MSQTRRLLGWMGFALFWPADNGFGLFLHPPGSPFGYNGRFGYGRVEWVVPR